MEERKCNACGAKLVEKDKFCGSCGAKVELQTRETTSHEEQLKPEMNQVESKPEDSNKNKAQKKNKVLGIIAVAVIVLLLAVGVKTMIGSASGSAGEGIVIYENDKGIVVNKNGKEYVFDEKDDELLDIYRLWYLSHTNKTPYNYQPNFGTKNSPYKEGLHVWKAGDNYISDRFIMCLMEEKLTIADLKEKRVEVIKHVVDYSVSSDEKSIIVQEDNDLNMYSTDDFDDEEIADDVVSFVTTSDFKKTFVVNNDGELNIYDRDGEKTDELQDDLNNGKIAIYKNYLLFNTSDDGYIVNTDTLETVKKYMDMQIDLNRLESAENRLYFKIEDDTYRVFENGEISELDGDIEKLELYKGYLYRQGYSYEYIKKMPAFKSYIGKSRDEIIFSPDGVASNDYDFDYDLSFGIDAVMSWYDNSLIISNPGEEEIKVITYKNKKFEDENIDVDSLEFLVGGKIDSMLATKVGKERYYYFNGEELKKLDTKLSSDRSHDIKHVYFSEDGKILLVYEDEIYLIDEQGQTKELYDDDDIEDVMYNPEQGWLAFKTDRDDLYIIQDHKEAELVLKDVEDVQSGRNQLYYIDSDDTLHAYNGKKTKTLSKEVSKMSIVQ